MWILECDGDILENKRIWLRPGKSYLFGRTKPEGGRYAGFAIKHKSVSRKHMTLSVAAVKPGQGVVADARSELSLKDEETKVGTEIDGVRVHGQTKMLRADEHSFRLGGFEHLFRIRWKPVVLTFTFPSKETKGGKDPLIPIRSRLEDLDIKTLIPYVVGKTTHVVAGKRNTAKCLQALVNAIHIVDNSFLDAITYATTPGNLDEPESLSPLEEDFDKNWPEAVNYLPAPSKEPGQRPQELFAPDANRKAIFHGLTFIFCDTRQFETLQPPITNAGGKAQYYEISSGKTTVEELVEDFTTTARDAHRGNAAKVSLVRFNGEKGYEEWATRLQQEISVTLGRHLVEQNEFLDAILINDPTSLLRYLPQPEGGSSPAVTRSSGRRTQHTQEEPAAEADSAHAPTRRGRTRGTIKSAFTGFDDGFDPSQVVGVKRSASTGSRNRRQLYQRSQSVEQPDAIMEEDADGTSQQITSETRKRPARDDLLGDDLLPAAAAMKRRKLEDAEERNRTGSKPAPAKGQAKDGTPKKKKKEIDIQEAVRERREAEDAKAQEDEESLHQTLQGMSVDEMKKLAVVEEMKVPERRVPANRANGHDERWDPRWNGRKNFKKFRRQGEGGPTRRGQTVIVPLEEVKKRSQGVSGSYLLENSSSSRRRKDDRREREQEYEREDEEQANGKSQSRPEDQQHEEEVPSELTAGGEHEVVDVDAPRTTRLQDKRGETEQRMNKRAAPAAGGRGTSKRQKTLALREESDSDDEMKFRFRKKR